MSVQTSNALQRHSHDFLGEHHGRNERRTWSVVALTGVMMVVEIVSGLIFGSMALLADGIHMATHAGALTITGGAYWFARRHADNERFTFGTGKVGDLAGFSSALILALVAVALAFESVSHLLKPIVIAFDQAIAVAVVGLLVNLVSALLLRDEHAHGHDEHHADYNLRSAYFHVLADALTSMLAIAALLMGRFFGLVWMDPLMGIVGAIVIGRWAWGLMRDTAAVLLDASCDPRVAQGIRSRIETGGDRITDLHVWRVGPGHSAAIVALVTSSSRDAEDYKARLADLDSLAHVTVEVSRRRSGSAGQSSPDPERAMPAS